MSRPNISNISKPPIRPPFIPRTIINQRVVDPSIIAKLFLICQEGVISNIKNYIISKGLNANDLVNTDGQSILHVILLNDSITPREKTDLFKFLASRNLLKFSYDSQQKTPLHIASEKQLTDIVKILLGASHDINALDSTKRTPIYYAIAGTEVDCPKKEKKLIEKKKSVKLSLQDELNEEIVNFINGNAEIKNLLLHIYNTTKNLDSIYNDEITKILEDDNKKIMEILVTEKDEEKKKEKIFEKVYETRNSIINLFLKQKFTSTLKPISFNKVDANTWGPDENPVNKFLNDVEPSVILKDLEQDFDKQKMIVIQDLDKIISKNLTLFTEFKDKYLQEIENGVNDLNFYSIMYDILKQYSSQSLAGGSKINKHISSKKIIKKVIKKYIQLGGANSNEVTQVLTFMTANIPGLSAEAEIMKVLPKVVGEMIDADTRFVRRFNTIPVNPNFLGQIYAKVIENKPDLINNVFLVGNNAIGLGVVVGQLEDENILQTFIRTSNNNSAEKIAETIYNTYQNNDRIFTALVKTALESKPLIITHLVGFNNGQLFVILRDNLINVINNNNDLFEDINFIIALNSSLSKFPTLISGSVPLRQAINRALRIIIGIEPSFLFNKILIDEYLKNNNLFDRLIKNLIPTLITRPLVGDPRLINLLQNNKQLFEKILEKFNTANLAAFPPPGLTPQQITDLTTLFVSSLIHYNLTDPANAQLNINYSQLDLQILNQIQPILDNSTLVTNIKNAYTPHPTIAQIVAIFPQFQPDDDVKRALTQVLNNTPTINVANNDELAKLFSDVINVNNQITINDKFINFISTNQVLLSKIIELQVGNEQNIYAIFEKSINAPGSTIGSRDPTKQYLIDNYKIVENLINVTRNIPINILIDLIKQILNGPNRDTFINDIQTNINLIKNNKNLTAELVNQARGPLLLPIAKLLCVINDNHENNELVKNLVKNVDLLQELCSNELRAEIPQIMSNDNISKLIQATINIPRSTISKNINLINKIKDNIDLAIELCVTIYQIPEDMISKIIIPLLDDFNSLSGSQKNALKTNLKDNFYALAEIIKNNRKTTTQNILSEILFEYFITYNPGNINVIAPTFIENKDQLYRLIENDTLKNPVNADNIRKNLALLIITCFITEHSLLNDKNIIKLLINEKSVINYLIDKFAKLRTGLSIDEIANFIKIFIIKNNAVSSESLVKLKSEIMLKIIGSEYDNQIDYNMIAQAILAMVNRRTNYFDSKFDELAQIIKDNKPQLIIILADNKSTDTTEKIDFVAKLLNKILQLNPDFADERIKNILLNNSALIKKMNELKGQTPTIIGRLNQDGVKQLCKYDGEITFVDRRINDNTTYDLNTLPDEKMQNPSRPKTKFVDEFHSEYEQLIKDHQTDFVVFNGGTSFIRKIKIIHTKIRLLYDEIETINGKIKIELDKTLEDINLKELFENIIKINAQILSIVNYLTLFYSEFLLVKSKLNQIITNLKEEVKQLKIENKSINIPSKNKKIEYSLFYESLLKIFEKLDSTKKTDDVQDLYRNIIDLQESLNRTINFINITSSTKYIIEFDNGLTDFNQIFTTNTTSEIKNLFNRNIPLLPRLYAKFEVLLNELTQDVKLNKLNLINKFLPQFNQYNFFSYYQNAVGSTQQPRIGFMVPQNYLKETVLNDKPKLTYGINGIADEIKNANSSDTNNLFEYRIGVQNSIKPNKTDKSINYINLLLDKHFLIIKNFIIRKLIEQLYYKLNSTGTGSSTDKLKELLKKTNLEIKEKLNLPEDNLQLFLTMLAKNIDQILNANFINFIQNGITRFGFREKRHSELEPILDQIAQIKSPGTTDDNSIHIINTNLEELTKPNDIVSVIKSNPNAYRIEYEEDVMTEKVSHSKKFKPIGLNDDISDKCFKTDIELIKLLIDNRAQINNIIDNAIESNNPDIVKLLIDRTSVYNEKSRNANGFRPYDLVISQIKYFGSIIDSKMIDNLIEESLTEISKKTSSTFQMRYHELFYRMFYILFNHLLLDLTNQMKYENKKKLRKKLNFTKEAFPLNKYINYKTMIKRNDDIYVRDNTNVRNEILDIEIKDNSGQILKVIDIKEKIKNLKSELNDVQDRPTEIRKKIIEDELRELQSQSQLLSLSGLNTKTQKLNDDKIRLRKYNNKYSNEILRKQMKKLEKKKNFMDMYKSLDSDVFDGDIKTVNNVLTSIFKKEKIDEIDLIGLLSTYIKMEQDFDDEYEEMIEFLKIITQFASDYVELDQQLHTENYALEKIYEILSYLLKHTISINLKNIIQQLLRSELTKITPQQTMTADVYSELIDEQVDKIIVTSKIKEYIETKLIDRIIISSFNLSSDKTDIQQHFDYITKIISLNGIIPITMDSELVKTLSTNIYPYFVIYTEINMKKIKMLISGIFNILTNLNNSLDIYKMVSDKAKKEK